MCTGRSGAWARVHADAGHGAWLLLRSDVGAVRLVGLVRGGQRVLGSQSIPGRRRRRGGSAAKQASYVDILCDFVVYALLPIALCVALTDALAPLDAVALVQRDSIVHTLLPDLVPRDISMRSLFVILALLESTYFVNAASQMFLASILEKRAQGAKANGTQPARLQACVCARALARWLTATTTWRSALGGAVQGSSRRSRCQ